MAIIANKYDASLKIIIDAGLNPDTNKRMTKTKSFTNVRADATDEGLFAAAQALTGLQTHSVIAVRKQEIYELVSE